MHNKNKMILDKPIIITGAARSGTTIIGNIIGKHSDVAYWVEPNYIWKYKSAKLHTDMIPKDYATKEVKNFIISRFVKFTELHNKKRFAEKTPANSLRLPFVREVLPNCKIIHIVRDGRDVALSARKMWMNVKKNNRFNIYSNSDINEHSFRYKNLKLKFRKLKQISISDFPYYIPRICNDFLVILGLKDYYIWGPEFPGIKTTSKICSLLEVCGLQWKWCVESVINYKKFISKCDFFEIKYEDFCKNPRNRIQEITDFLELSSFKNLDEIVPLVKNSNFNKWKKELSDEELRDLYKYIGTTLQLLGYL